MSNPLKGIDFSYESQVQEQILDISITLESIETLVSSANDALTNRAGEITSEMVSLYHKHSAYLANNLMGEAKALGIKGSAIKDTFVSLESIDDFYTDPKIALEGIVDAIKKGIDFIIKFILGIINAVLAVLVTAAGLIVLAIWLLYQKIIEIVSNITHWVKGGKIKGQYHFEKFEDIAKCSEEVAALNKMLTAPLSTAALVVLKNFTNDIVKQKKYGLFDSFYLPKIKTLTKQLYHDILGKTMNGKFIVTEATSVDNAVKYNITITSASNSKMKAPTKKKIVSALTDINTRNHKLYFTENVDNLKKLEAVIKEMVHVKIDKNDTTTKEAVDEFLKYVREFVLMSAQTMDVIAKVYRIQCKDVVTLTSNLPGVELPDDWKDDVTQVFTKESK